MTHLIDGDDLAVVVEPVGLGAKDLHLRSSAGSAGRVWVSAAGFSFGLLLGIWLSAASAGRRQPDRSPNVARPRPRRARARYGHAPRCWVSRTRPGRGRDSFGKRSWESLTLAPRGGPMGSGFFSSAGLAASPHPVGRERGTRAERSAMARGRVFASTARVFGPSARPETPTARVSGGARGAKVLSFGEICTRRWCRGNGRGWARTAARTRKATRDCFWDLAESFLLALERGINGRKSAHGRPDRTRQRLERPIGKLLPQAMEKNRAGTSSCDAETARGGSRGHAPGDRGAGSEGRGGAGEGGHDCLLGGYRNVRCRVL